jgi:hypothetical protein
VAGISWLRNVESSISIDSEVMEVKSGAYSAVIRRPDVELLYAADQGECERLCVLQKGGVYVDVPEPCFLRVGPVIDHIKRAWPEVVVRFNMPDFPTWHPDPGEDKR